jgi:hypothetical protein
VRSTVAKYRVWSDVCEVMCSSTVVKYRVWSAVCGVCKKNHCSTFCYKSEKFLYEMLLNLLQLYKTKYKYYKKRCEPVAATVSSTVRNLSL